MEGDLLMEAFKKYWPLVVIVLNAAAPLISPAVQAFWAHHTFAAASIDSGLMGLKWLLPSPLQSK